MVKSGRFVSASERHVHLTQHVIRKLWNSFDVIKQFEERLRQILWKLFEYFNFLCTFSERVFGFARCIFPSIQRQYRISTSFFPPHDILYVFCWIRWCMGMQLRLLQWWPGLKIYDSSRAEVAVSSLFRRRREQFVDPSSAEQKSHWKNARLRFFRLKGAPVSFPFWGLMRLKTLEKRVKNNRYECIFSTDRRSVLCTHFNILRVLFIIFRRKRRHYANMFEWEWGVLCKKILLMYIIMKLYILGIIFCKNLTSIIKKNIQIQ